MLAFTTTTLCFQSCKDEKNATVATVETPKEVAIEILQEKEKVQYAEAIYTSENAEFCKGEYIQSLPQQMRMHKAKSSTESDTISNAEEIPIMNSEAITQNIYADGSFSYIVDDKTTDDMLFLEKLNVNPQPENEKVVKTEIKNNVAYLYNSSGELLKSESIGDVSFKPMLDSLQTYLANQAASKAPQSMRVKANIALNKATASGMKVISQNSTEVVMEMNMGSSSSTISRRVKSMVAKKAIMRFSPDMSRMYSQKIYEGQQLTQSVEMEYADSNEPNFTNTVKDFSNSMLPNANIKLIKHKILMEKPDGTPFINNNIENYTKNQVIYHFVKK